MRTYDNVPASVRALTLDRALARARWQCCACYVLLLAMMMEWLLLQKVLHDYVYCAFVLIFLRRCPKS